MELITVVIPVFNGERFLERAIRSCLGSTSGLARVVVVDDGSTDGSAKIVSNLIPLDSRVAYVYQENKGLGAARNLGISQVSSEYVLFLDADDWLEEGALDLLARTLAFWKPRLLLFDTEPDFSEVDFSSIERSRKVDYYRRNIAPFFLPSRIAFSALYWTKSYLPSACLYTVRSDFLQQNDFLFRTGVFMEDVDFTLKLLLSGGWALYIGKILHRRRFTPGSITSKIGRKHREDLLFAVEEIRTFTHPLTRFRPLLAITVTHLLERYSRANKSSVKD